MVPEVPVGTRNEHENDPVARVVRPPPPEQLEIVTPSNTRATGLETEKPVPVTVTRAPTGPRVGLTVIFGTVTVNTPVAELPPASVARTVVPDVPLITEKPQLKVPEALVARLPLVQLETETPSNVRVTELDTENPLPLTLTGAPMGPRFGETVSDRAVTVNVPEAWVPPASVAVTVVPDVPLGTGNEQLNVPEASEVKEPLEQVANATAPKERATGVETENPVPATVTAAPTGPWPGVTVIRTVVTVNVPVDTWPPPSVAVTVVPDVPLGTENPHEKAPAASEVVEPLVHAATVTPSNVSATGWETEKPVPETVTAAPTGPCPGPTVI